MNRTKELSRAMRFIRRHGNRIREIHGPDGRHRRNDVPFPAWLDLDVIEAAQRLALRQVTAETRVWLERYGAD